MYTLSEKQIAFIHDDLKRNGIETEDLQQNLLDHICCMLENTMQEQDDFAIAYGNILKQFYKQNLKEIQEETDLLLTYKNYYNMKKLMFISGTYSSLAFITGSVLKIIQQAGASFMLISATLVFSIVFLPLVFLLKTKEQGTTRDKLVLFLATLAGVLYCLSMLFQLQHWQGSSMIWLSTLGFSAFVLLPLYFITGVKRPETRINTIVTSIILIGLIGMQFTLTALHRKEKSDNINIEQSQALPARLMAAGK